MRREGSETASLSRTTEPVPATGSLVTASPKIRRRPSSNEGAP